MILSNAPHWVGCVAVVATSAMLGCGESSSDTCSQEPGTICTWAGTGQAGFDGDGNSLKDSRFYWPMDVSFTEQGTFILDWNNHRVRQVVGGEDSLQTVIGTDFVGDGPADLSDLTAPGAPGTSIDLNHPTAILDMPDGRLLLVAWHNHKLRVYDPNTGLAYVACGRGAGFEGDGEPLDATRLNQPSAARYAADGSLYILDQRNQRIRRISELSSSGTIETVVGSGELGFSGDGGPPLEAQVSFPSGSNPPPAGSLDFDDVGRLYFADILNNRVRRVDFEQDTIETVLGDGTEQALHNPRDVQRGPDGRIYVADEHNHRVIALDPETLNTQIVAGTGAQGAEGDGGPATEATLNRPSGVAFDADENLVVADSYNHKIRVVYGGTQ